MPLLQCLLWLGDLVTVHKQKACCALSQILPSAIVSFVSVHNCELPLKGTVREFEYTSTPGCFAKLGACQLPSAVGNTLWISTSYNHT